ncbi:unnamed protein product [Camellia sinensis]
MINQALLHCFQAQMMTICEVYNGSRIGAKIARTKAAKLLLPLLTLSNHGNPRATLSLSLSPWTQLLSAAAAIITLLLIAAVSPAHALGGSSSTIAVIYGSATVCGIVAEQTTRRIQCWRNDQLIEISSAISFDYIAGGRDNFCGVKSSWLCSPQLGLQFHLHENLQQQFGALTTPHIWG